MLNKVILIGRLGAEPEVRFMPNGDQVTSLRVATTRRWKDRNTGERKEETEWHRVVIFGALAKIAGDHLKKGSLAYFEGRIRTQKYQAQDGSDRYSTDIICDTMNMLDGKPADGQAGPQGGHSAGQQGGQQAPAQSQSAYPDFDDDIPFASLNQYIKNHLI